MFCQKLFLLYINLVICFVLKNHFIIIFYYVGCHHDFIKGIFVIMKKKLINSALKFQIFTLQDCTHFRAKHLAITCGFVETPYIFPSLRGKEFPPVINTKYVSFPKAWHRDIQSKPSLSSLQHEARTHPLKTVIAC